MLLQRILRISYCDRVVRAAAATSRPYTSLGGKNRDAHDPLHRERAHAQTIHRDPEDTTPLDAASSHASGQKPASHDDFSGNPEGVGFAEQVGSQSASADKSASASSHEGFNGEENITPPSFTDAIKKKLGLKTTVGEDKQNRGAGEGVTGTGVPRFDSGKRTVWTSAVPPNEKTKGQAPEASRQPKERTNADQNEHLSHRTPSTKAKQGKGNAAENPTLPSHQLSDRGTRGPSGGTREFSTTLRRLADEKPKHTAETYFKDVDSTSASSSKVHQVDSSAMGAQVQQTGQFSQEGPGDKEYETVSKHEQPYDTPPSSGPERDQKLRYGGTSGVESEKSPSSKSMSSSQEGPQGANKGGRKSEGKF